MPVRFYTYLWLRLDGTPWYVGKGKGKRAFRKGSPPIDRILLQEHPSEEDAFAAEIFLINYYGRVDLGTGCLHNHSDGGDGIHNISEQTRQKKRQVMLGRKASSEARRKMSASRIGTKYHLGHKHSEEARAKIRAARAKQVFSLESRARAAASNRGRKRSLESRLRMSEGQKGNHNKLGWRKVRG